MSASVLICDPLRLVRAGIRQILESVRDLEVAGEAGDGREVIELARELQPDIVLLEAQLPRLSGSDATRGIREVSPRSRCVILSSQESPKNVRQALLAGAAGVLPKDSSASELLQAIATVREGRKYLAPSVADHVVSAITTSDGDAGGGPELTGRQREVLQLVAEGLSTKEIAAELGVSLKTAQTHRANLMSRVGVHKASGLVRYAIREGLVRA